MIAPVIPPLATYPCAFALLAISAVHAHAGPLPSERWMTHCADNLEGEESPPEVVRKYCACMGAVGEEAEMLTWSQGELERSYPPAHKVCHVEARER